VPERSIAASPPTVSAATVEPASAVFVVATTVVSTRGFVSVVLPAATRAEDDACDHQYNHHDPNYKERSH
jgi:hypothetical protein